MPPRRPFLSYCTADRGVVERVARTLVARGLAPIFDHWWLRDTPATDFETSCAEIRIGIDHADSFVHFDSPSARDSAFVSFECDHAMWRTCSDAPALRMVHVALDGAGGHVPRWFKTRLDVSDRRTDPDAIASEVVDALGARLRAPLPRALAECRRLAAAGDLGGLRAALRGASRQARIEAAILLAFLGEEPDPHRPGFLAELGRGLATGEAERAVLAIGRLRDRAAPLAQSLAAYVDTDADVFARVRAVHVLGRMGCRPDIVDALARISTHGVNVRAAAICVLGNMGAGAARAVPTLVAIAQSTHLHLRLCALSALGSIGDRRTDVLVAVLNALAEERSSGLGPSQLHHNAMCLLNQLQPEDDELGRAIAVASRHSLEFATWLRAHVPQAADLFRTVAGEVEVPTGSIGAPLRQAARWILAGSRLLAGNRPF